MLMCAIAGVLDLPILAGVPEKMKLTMLRRGPDGSGIHQEPGCTLIHTRLAIIDPLGGAQPMVLEWGGEKLVLVYNGELYNTEELRLELQRLGHKFVGHSDTEVVLHAYAQWGCDAVDRFNGIFAMAVWEQRRRRLFLARDRIGVKPLFYKCHEGGLIFASEIKTVLAYPTVRAELDREGAAQIMLLGPGRTPGSGVFRNILELEPGWMGYYEDGRFTPRRYWSLRDREHTENFDETLEQVRYLVTDAIRRQMVSDAPIGTFLSGGLDSSIISAVCAGDMRKHGQVLDTFSVDYLDNDRYFVAGKFQPNSDNSYIRIMVDALGSRHHRTVLGPEELLGCMEAATEARDLPGMADVDFSLLAFCRQIRKTVKVGLSGECADEIFGGYPWYRDPSIREQDGFPWSQNVKQRAALLLPEWKLDGADFVRSQYERTIRESDILPGVSPLERRMKEMVNLNFRWFMQTLLDRKDRMSMYNGLEVRVPFCDYRIAEYLYGVPWEFKDYRGREKGLLRQAVEELLPEEVVYRKKSPYPKTHHPAYTSLVRGRLELLLDRRDAPLWSLVDGKAVRAMLEDSSSTPWYGQLMTLPQTMAYLLQINHWLTRYDIALM